MIKRVDRYVGKAALLGVLGVWSVLIMLAAMFNLLGNHRTEGTGVMGHNLCVRRTERLPREKLHTLEWALIGASKERRQQMGP